MRQLYRLLAYMPFIVLMIAILIAAYHIETYWEGGV